MTLALLGLWFAAEAALAARPLDKALYPARVEVAGPVAPRWDFRTPGVQRWRVTTDATSGPIAVHFATDLLVVVAADAPVGSPAVTVTLAKGEAAQTRDGVASTVQVPETKVGTLRGDGTLTAPKENTPVRTLFALPPRPLRVGEKVAIPIEIATTLPGTLAILKAPITMQLARVVRCGKSRCAQLEWTLDLQRAAPELALKVTGAGVTYFDLDLHRLMAADVYYEVALHPTDGRSDLVTAQLARVRPLP